MHNKFVSLLLAILLIVSTVVMPVSAADSVDDTYVFHRDANGQNLYMFQSPVKLGYDLGDLYEGTDSVGIQAFLYTMYNTKTEEHFPTYCTDINTTAIKGAYYRRLNLEDSPFAGSEAGKIRAILTAGFYVVPAKGESYDSLAARVQARTDALAAASGVAGLTTGEAIAATQAAIWRAAHGPALEFPNFCRDIYNPTQTTYRDMCSYLQVYTKGKAAAAATVEAVYDYLLSLPPVEATSEVVSVSSFVKMENMVATDNGDGTNNVFADITMKVDMGPDDSLTFTAKLGEASSETFVLTDGEQTIKLMIPNVPEADVSEKIKILITGTQTVSGFFYFDAMGGRDASQAMVAYDNSTQPVYMELTVKPKPDDVPDEPEVYTGGINLKKVDAADGNPLEGASFAVYRAATAAEIAAGGENIVEIPGVTAKVVQVFFYDNSALEGNKVNSVTSGVNGEIAIYGLPYGDYYLVETVAPLGYNLLGEAEEVTIDATSHMEGNTLTIENNSGTFLPSTGGIGTTGYTVSGMLLICCACLFLFLNKRKMSET